MKLKATIEEVYDEKSEQEVNLNITESADYRDAVNLWFNGQSIHVNKGELLKALKVFMT